VISLLVKLFLSSKKTRLRSSNKDQDLVHAERFGIFIAFVRRTIKFAKTQIGEIHAEIKASAIPTRFGSNSHSFRSEPFGFEISYPIDGWTEQTEAQNDEFRKKLGDLLNAQFIAFLLKSELKDCRLPPTVTVVLQPIIYNKVAKYAAVTFLQLFQIGAKLTT
jgi:hypothetical protein